MSRNIAERGRLCLEAARTAHQLIINRPEEAIESLRSLEEDGRTLYECALIKQNELTENVKESEDKLSALCKEKQQYELRKSQLEGDRSRAQLSRTKEENSLRIADQDLDNARSYLRDAESSLESARREREKRAALSAFGTFAATLFFGPVGFAAGAVASTAALSDAEGDVKRARDRIDQCNRTVNDAKSRVDCARQSLQRIESDIRDCDSKLSQCLTQINEKHKEIGAAKQSIAVLIEAASLWELFGQAANDATEKTDLLRQIVTMAEHFENREILTSQGTVIMVTSFIEAWEGITGQAANESLTS